METGESRREFIDVAEQEATDGLSRFLPALFLSQAFEGRPNAHALQPRTNDIDTFRGFDNGITTALRPHLDDPNSSNAAVQFSSFFMFEKRASLTSMLRDKTTMPLISTAFPELQKDASVDPEALNVVVISTSPTQRANRLRSAGGIYHIDPGFQKMAFILTNMGSEEATCQMTLIREVPTTDGAVWAHASPHYVFKPRFRRARDANQCVLTVIGIGDPTDDDFLGMETAYQTPNYRAEVVPLERSTDPNEVILKAGESVIQTFDQYKVSEDGPEKIERYKQFRKDVMIPAHTMSSTERYKDFLTSAAGDDSSSDDDPFF